MDDDPLNNLQSLEDEYYREGYELGVSDGTHAGFVEGKLFGIEKGYEKGLEIGRLYGRALVWDLRLKNATKESNRPGEETLDGAESKRNGQPGNRQQVRDSELPLSTPALLAHKLPAVTAYARLEKHIETLLTLVDPKSLSLENSDDAVADLDDRLRRAAAKAKIIEKAFGEVGDVGENSKYHGSPSTTEQGTASNNIEDLRNAFVRR